MFSRHIIHIVSSIKITDHANLLRAKKGYVFQPDIGILRNEYFYCVILNLDIFYFRKKMPKEVQVSL